MSKNIHDIVNQLIIENKEFLAFYYENPWYLVKCYIFTTIKLNLIKVKINI